MINRLIIHLLVYMKIGEIYRLIKNEFSTIVNSLQNFVHIILSQYLHLYLLHIHCLFSAFQPLLFDFKHIKIIYALLIPNVDQRLLTLNIFLVTFIHLILRIVILAVVLHILCHVNFLATYVFRFNRRPIINAIIYNLWLFC